MIAKFTESGEGFRRFSSTTDNAVLGPTFFDGLTIHLNNPKDLCSHEWRRQLKSATGHTKFRISYYGKLHDKYPGLIVGTDFAPSLVYAIDIVSGQEILIFDGCKHGYNALLCDTYTSEQNNNRQTTNIYRDRGGYDTFEVFISTFYGIDFDDEFLGDVDANGLIETVDGNKISIEMLKRNAYEMIQILVTNERGKTIEIISEELA